MMLPPNCLRISSPVRIMVWFRQLVSAIAPAGAAPRQRRRTESQGLSRQSVGREPCRQQASAIAVRRAGQAQTLSAVVNQAMRQHNPLATGQVAASGPVRSSRGRCGA